LFAAAVISSADEGRRELVLLHGGHCTDALLQTVRAVTSEQQRDNVSAELHQLRVTSESLDARYKETALLLRESDNRNRALKEEMFRATERLSPVDSESRMLR
jgi:hypothetical protein